MQQTTETLAELDRMKAIAKARRLALNGILQDTKEATSLDVLRAVIAERLDTLEGLERHIMSR